MIPLCPKGTRKSPCAGPVAAVLCCEEGAPPLGQRVTCARLFERCEAHGGLAGARRSLSAHRGVYHPGEKGDER